MPDIGQKIGPDDAGIVHHDRDRKAPREIRRRLFRRLGIDQIDLDRMQRRVRPIGLAAGNRNYLTAGIDHLPADRCADTGAAAGVDGNRSLPHAGHSGRASGDGFT